MVGTVVSPDYPETWKESVRLERVREAWPKLKSSIQSFVDSLEALGVTIYP